MNLSPTLLQELNPLLEALCEERLTDAEFARFEQLLVEEPAARAYYLEYIDLHAALYWDTALAPQGDEDPVAELVDATVLRLARPDATAEPLATPQKSRKRSPAWVRQAASVAAACVLLGLGVWIGNRTANTPDVAAADPHSKSHTPAPPATKHVAKPDGTGHQATPPHVFGSNDVKLGSQVNQPSATSVESQNVASTDNDAADTELPAHPSTPERKNFSPVQTNTAGSSAASAATVLAFVNEQLRAGWTQSGVTPSPRADDAEWLRRVHLDLVGHIPSVHEVEKFLANKGATKRSAEIDRLLDSPDFSRHFAAIWTDLLIGRASRPEVNRRELAKFMRQSFQQNRPWTEIVYDLVTAEGRTDQNGATNFLVAHLNNGAIPATGIVSRLFLGSQLQCAQCHNHPFDGPKQESFWAFNSFFQQAVVVRGDEKFDPKTGRMVIAGIKLATKAAEGPVYFETRNGLMKVAYPQYGETKIDPQAGTSRRRELARLMQSEGPGLAPAFVNRVWQQLHGRAFTPVVDDMGPHSAPSHPALLDRLSEEFALSGYDVKQLIRWICNSESYQLTSRFTDGNSKDNPEAGETPLFSHVYVKPMTAEQLYDSLVVATQGQLAGGKTLDQSDSTRDKWLTQFVVSFETEENDETMTLDGSITQSLLMMNGDLVRNATSMQTGTWLHKLLSSKKSDTERIQSLFQSALSRPATVKELAMVKKLLKSGANHAKGGSPESAYQDIYWALLNSNEFILNH